MRNDNNLKKYFIYMHVYTYVCLDLKLFQSIMKRTIYNFLKWANTVIFKKQRHTLVQPFLRRIWQYALKMSIIWSQNLSSRV